MRGRRLILASGSAARRQMLREAGVSFEILPADIDEDRIRDEMTVSAEHREIAVALAEAKALQVAARHPDALVIGSDQILSAGRLMLSKPQSREGARQTLQTLRGTTHWLHSGVALATRDGIAWRTVESAALTMRPLTDAEIESYLDEAGASVFGCVGAYQIEGVGRQLFDRIEGDHFTIMGMPLSPLLHELRREGVAA